MELEWVKTNEGFAVQDENGDVAAEIFIEDLGNGTYNISHTYVSDSLRGMGMASQLVQRAVDWIHGQGGTPAATCSYASSWLERQKEKGQAE